MEKLAPKRLQKRVQKSQILVMFEFSRHGQRIAAQSNKRDGRRSPAALGYSISGASFEENGSPKASTKGREFAHARAV